MTSRGNQSVSPPAQISQQRHVNSISSSTPPPQQYYQGPPSALSQGAYEFLPQAQGHPFNPYQAYGSSLSDTRGQPGNSGRGVPNQQNLAQGNNYYQQPGPNIRPQQAQQSQHTYYLTAQPQGNMRHPRPPHQSQMMFISQNFTPTNSVITVPANMYPSARVPMYPPNAFVQGGPSYPNIVYYQNGTPQWRGPAIQPTAVPTPRPVQREKKVLSIQDPDTGRDITEELLNSKSHSVSVEEHDDELTGNPNNKEICQTFCRLVADRLKSPDDSSSSGVSSDSHGSASNAPITSAAGAPSSLQFQPPLPQQNTQQHQPSSIAAATGMRPPAAGPHVIPAANSGTPPQTPPATAQPHDAQHQVLSVNLSMPPPQYPLRQPTQAVYSAVAQHQHPPAHHAPRHTHSSQQQQQPIRPPAPSVIQSPPQQTPSQPLQPQHQPPPHPVHSQPPNTVIDPVPQTDRAEPSVSDKPKPLVEATPQDNIPAKPTAPSSSVEPAPSVLPKAAEDADNKPSSVKPGSSEEASIIDKAGDNGRGEASQGVISQGMKDGRKGKKGKKDFNRKDIGGSDMDAFIDSFKKTQETKSNPMKTKPEAASASLMTKGKDTGNVLAAKNVPKRDPKNPWNIPSATDASGKKDAHNPWAVKGQESAQAKLPVSISSTAQGKSGDRPNPWRIIPVQSLEANPVMNSERIIPVQSLETNPITNSDISKSTVPETTGGAEAVICKSKVPVGTDEAAESKVMTTVPSSKCNTLPGAVISSAVKSKTVAVEPRQNQCQVQDTQTHPCPKPNLAQNVYFNRSLAPKPLATSDYTNAQGGLRPVTLSEKSTSGALFENPWHRKLPAVVLNKHDASTNVKSANSTRKCVNTAKQNDVHSSTKRMASSDCHAIENDSAQVDLQGHKNSIVPPVELLKTVKPENFPVTAATSSMVIFSTPHCVTASQSTKVNCHPIVSLALSLRSEVKKPQNKGTTHNPGKVRKMCVPTTRGQESVVCGMVLIESNRKSTLQKVDGASGGPGENNITRTNNALDIASEAGLDVQHSGQKAPDVEAKQVLAARAFENANLNAPRHFSAVESSRISLDSAPSRDDSPNPQKFAESQKQAAAAAVQVESKHKQKKKKKKGRKTPPNQKVKPCSSNQNSEVQSEVVEVDEKSAQSQPVLESKHVDKSAGDDIKTPSTPVTLSQEPSVTKAPPVHVATPAPLREPSVAKAPVHIAAPAPPREPTLAKAPPVNAATPASREPSVAKTSVHIATPATQRELPNVTKPPVHAATPAPQETEKKVVPVTESKPLIEASLTPSTPVATITGAPTNNQNQPKAEQTGDMAQSQRRALGQTDRPSSKPVENGVTDDVHSEPLPTISVNTVSDSSMGSYPLIDENDFLEPAWKQKSDQKSEEYRKAHSHGSSSSSASKPPAEIIVTQAKKDGKDKLQYDRAYLMELRECLSSQTKPDGLPNLEIILDRPVTGSSRSSSSAPLDFTPAFFQQSGSGQRHAPPVGKTNSRNRPRSDVQMPQRIIKSVSLQDSVKPLHQSEKPWKPKLKLPTGEVSETNKTLESEVLFIMNRLTPTNFERLAVEMRKLNIKTYEDLQQLVKIFFDKVTMETKFVEAYALLCKVMSGLRVQPPPNCNIKENQATFRVVMLTKCQQEFEADKTVVFEDPEEKKKKIEAEMPEGPERTEKIESTLYQMKLKRLKFYGNIRFIGELFKLNMLTENIMHDCIYRLLKARDDDSLVSLCNLITTVGRTLDTDKAKTRMDQYFAQMAKIAEERKSRIKFTLRDAIDMRNNGWTPRKEQTGPKKLAQVQKDYIEEQATKQFLQSQPLPPRNDRNEQPSSRRGSRQRQDENKPTDDGWNTVGSKSLRIDASKMKLSKNVVDENSIQLGPGGGMKQFSMWSRGSYGGTQQSQDNDSRQSAPGNRFSALRGEEDRRNYQRSPSRGDSSSLPNRNTRQGPPAGHGRGKILARSSQEGDRRDALASARSIVGGRSQNSSRDNSWNREDRRHTLPPRGSREGENVMTRSDILQPNTDPFLVPAVPPLIGATAAGFDDQAVKIVKPLSETEMEYKAKTILEEYLSVLDLEEAKLCLTELSGQLHLHVLVTACVNEVLERSSKDRDLTGSFFHEMVKHGKLSMDIYLKGLTDVLQYAEDIVIDIPMMWTYLAQIILPMLIHGSLTWASLPAVLTPSLGERGSAKLVAEILQLAKDKIGEEEVALMWQSSGLVWTAFLPAEEVDRFLKDKKLEFTVGQVSRAAARVPVYGQVDSQKLIEDVERLVRESATSSDIYAYVDGKVRADKQDRQFIRSLVTGVVNASISTQTMKFSEDIIKTHKDVLQHYIKSIPDLELQALYAIQALMHKLEHPSGVIANIFDVLYDEEVISEEAFKQWEKSSDPLEAEGKGACSMQLTQFFTWLRENEELETS